MTSSFSRAKSTGIAEKTVCMCSSIVCHVLLAHKYGCPWLSYHKLGLACCDSSKLFYKRWTALDSERTPQDDTSFRELCLCGRERERRGISCHNSKLTHNFRQSMTTESVSTTVNLPYPIPVRASDFVLTKGY